MLVNQNRAVAAKDNKSINEGDLYLTLNALTDYLHTERDSRPYSVEVELAFSRAVSKMSQPRFKVVSKCYGKGHEVAHAKHSNERMSQ